jgi:hypothetical protein
MLNCYRGRQIKIMHFSLDSRNENLPEERIHRKYAWTTVPPPPGSLPWRCRPT